MALVVHTADSLRDIVMDLRNATERLEGLRKGMDKAQVKSLEIDHHKAQVNARLALHRFCADGHERLRSAVAEKELQG